MTEDFTPLENYKKIFFGGYAQARTGNEHGIELMAEMFDRVFALKSSFAERQGEEVGENATVPFTSREKELIRAHIGAMHHDNQIGRWADWWKRYVKWTLQFIDSNTRASSPTNQGDQ